MNSQLFNDYEPLFLAKAKQHYQSILKKRYTFDEIVQECRIAFWIAEKSYKKDSEVTLGQYAKVVIDNHLGQIKIKEKSCKSVRHPVEIDAAEVDSEGSDEGWISKFESRDPNPEQALMMKRSAIAMRSIISEIDDKNIDIITRYVEGEKQSDIARSIGLSRQRVGQKINAYLNSIRSTVGINRIDRVYSE